MKKLSALLLLCLAVLISNAQQIDTTTRTKVGDLSPNFSFNITKDKVVSLSDYKANSLCSISSRPGARLVARNCRGCRKRFGKSTRTIPNLPYSLLTVKRTGITLTLQAKESFYFPDGA